MDLPNLPDTVTSYLKTSLIPLALVLLLFACKKQPAHKPSAPNADYKKAEAFLYVKTDSAFFYYNKVVAESHDSLLVAMSYNSMAAMQSDAGDYFGSQENLSTSLRYLDGQREKDLYCLSSDYNELGNTSLNLKHYDQAIYYYDLAIKFAQDPEFRLTFANNKAVAYQKMGAYPEAIAVYDSILPKTRRYKTDYARILSNRARTRWLQDTTYPAAAELLTALQIRAREKDDWGQNASYAHLSDYYAHTHQDSSLYYAGKMYAMARALNSPDDELEALQKLISLDAPQRIKQYFSRYQALSDSLQTARNTAKNQFALIRYETEKSKAENLQLQKENTDKNNQIILQWGALFIAGLLVVFIIILFRKRQQRIAWEAANTIRENLLRTSQKVHDVVANGLYRIMQEFQQNSNIDIQALTDKIEVMYEQSRDISYEPPPLPPEEIHETVARLLNAFKSDDIMVVTAGNNPALWKKVSPHTQKELLNILQELMVNMKKHSQATRVAILFEEADNQITIQYTDNGIGLPSEYKAGNGLNNTGNRIRKIKGTITFGTAATAGLKIQISFPTV